MGDDKPAGIGKGDHLYLIDGSGFIFRAYHALPPLTRKSDGLPVGAVAGFCNMLHKMLTGFGTGGPTHLAVIFDYSGKTFRNDLYPDYKAHRPPTPEDLVPQFPLIREATRAFGLPSVEMEGYEADDLIATYARQAAGAGATVTVVSSDKDLMQLVGGGIEMLDPMKNRAIGPDQVREKFGVGPERVVDVQALAGDSTDNVPGAPGIGVKTAALLIEEYGDLDTLLERAAEIKQPKRRQSLIDNADQIRLSRELVRLRDDVPGVEPLGGFVTVEPDPEALLGFLARMEFRTMTNRIAEAMGVEPPVIGPAISAAEAPVAAPTAADGPGAVRELPPIDRDAYVTIRDADTLADWIAEAPGNGLVCVDPETTSLDAMKAEIVGVALAPAPGRAAHVPARPVHRPAPLSAPGASVPGHLAAAAGLRG